LDGSSLRDLCAGLHFNETLRTLDISGNTTLGESGGMALASMLHSNRGLHTVDARHCGFNVASGDEIGWCLADNAQSVLRDLRVNQQGGRPASEAKEDKHSYMPLNTFLFGSRTLHTLHGDIPKTLLSWSYQILTNPNVTELRLYGDCACPADDCHCGNAIAALLHTNRVLRKLAVVGDVYVPNAAAEKLVAALNRNRVLVDLVLARDGRERSDKDSEEWQKVMRLVRRNQEIDVKETQQWARLAIGIPYLRANSARSAGAERPPRPGVKSLRDVIKKCMRDALPLIARYAELH